MDEKPMKNDQGQDQGSNQAPQDSDSVHDALKQQDTQEVAVNIPQPTAEESDDDLYSMDEVEISPGDQNEKNSLPESALDSVPEDTAQIVVNEDPTGDQDFDEISEEHLDLDPGAAGGWWAGAPFLPMDEIEDVDFDAPFSAVAESLPPEPNAAA